MIWTPGRFVRGGKRGGPGFGFVFGGGLWRSARGGGGRGFFAPESLEINAIAFDPQAHLPFGEAEATGGRGHVAVGVFQFADDHFEFEGGDGGVEGAGGGGGFGGVFFLQGGREVMRFDGWPVGEQDGTFHGVLEFADVAWPMVAHEEINGGGGNALDGLAVGSGVFFYEMIGEEKDVRLAFAERGHKDGEDIKAVVQVGPEFAVFDHAFKVAAGGGDDADVGVDGRLSADAFEFLFLEDAEEFDLGLGRDIADFIKKDGAAGGGFKAALAEGEGAGESAFFVPEKLAFDDGFGKGGAVKFDECAGFAGALFVERAGDEFLADAGFAADEDGGDAAGDLLNVEVNGAHGVRVADNEGGAHRGLDLFLEALVFIAQGGDFLISGEVEMNDLGDDVGDERQESAVGGEVGEMGDNAFGAEAADYLLTKLDGHAQEGEGRICGAGARGLLAPAFRQGGFAGDVGHHDGLAGFGDDRDDLMTGGEVIFLGNLLGQADGFADGDLTPVADGDGAAAHAEDLGHFGEHGTDDFAELEAAFEGVGNIEQKPEFIDDTTILRFAIIFENGDRRHTATTGGTRLLGCHKRQSISNN